MKITSFDRTNLRVISEDLKTALKGIEEKFGISFTYKGARFDSKTATFKIEGVTIGENGVENSRERSAFESLCSMYGLSPEMLDQKITYGGTEYYIRGLNPRSRSYPVNAERVRDGRNFKLDVAQVKLCWESQNR